MDKAKEAIVQKLKASGCRITKQRLMLLDIILEENCSCCKEIYYRASRIDPSIGTATVYRMINKLEEIGAINRRNMYKVACDPDCDLQNACTVELDDDTIKHSVCKELECCDTGRTESMWLCRRSESTEHNSAVINMQLIKFINSLKIFEKDIPWCYNLQKQKRLPDTNEGMSFLL